MSRLLNIHLGATFAFRFGCSGGATISGGGGVFLGAAFFSPVVGFGPSSVANTASARFSTASGTPASFATWMP